MTPSCMQASSGRMPTPTIRAFQIGCPVSSLSYSGSRDSMILMNWLIRSIEFSGSSWATPPGRMNAMFIRSPVRNSIRCRASSRSRKPAVIAGQRTEFHAAGGQRHQVRGDPGQLHQQHPDHLGAHRNLDAQQLLDRHAVRGLVERRRQVVGPGDEGDALGPGAVLAGLLDAGVQVADDRPGLHDGLALEFEDQPQHAVGGRVLRTHVDDDAFVVLELGLGQQVVPVAAGDGEHPALGGVRAAGPRGPSPSLPELGRAVLQVGRQEVLGELRREARVSAIGSGSVSFVMSTTSAGPGRGSRRPCIPPGSRRAGSPCVADARSSRPASGSWSDRGGRRS